MPGCLDLFAQQIYYSLQERSAEYELIPLAVDQGLGTLVWSPLLYDTVEVLVEIAEGHGVSAAQVALRWLLTRPTVSSVIVGARTEAQLADNLAAAHLVLSADELARLEQVSRPELLYPYWHQLMTASARLSAADLSLIAPHLG